ncbi:MAG: hypothetical protein RIE86_09250 [Imperialibacter sp.]|uniref:hypothetical protein n=1 Tax=Imperialibacter sp. TaxID=2038411 RepID=UPI0032EB9F04
MSYKHWMRFLYDSGRWGKMIASDMEILYARRDKAKQELDYAQRLIDKEEEKIMTEVKKEWNPVEIMEAKEAARTENYREYQDTLLIKDFQSSNLKSSNPQILNLEPNRPHRLPLR